MKVAPCNYVQVVRFIRKLRGNSQPVLVEGIDGIHYLLKFRNNPQGLNVSFNEAAGSELYRAFHLSVPRWERLYISKSFLDRNRACWLVGPSGKVRPEYGLCFGARFITQSHSRAYEILPASHHARIVNRHSFWLAWILDVCCGHVDHRQAVFVERGRGRLESVFIDSGGLFGGSHGIDQPDPRTCTYIDARIYPEITQDDLRVFIRKLGSLDTASFLARIRSLPLEWQTETAVARLEQALDSLQRSDHIETLLGQLLHRSDAQIGRRANRGQETDASGALYLSP